MEEKIKSFESEEQLLIYMGTPYKKHECLRCKRSFVTAWRHKLKICDDCKFN